ncbi:small heat shock protein [Irpex rosettiformis]|uniref:Small heat shock protein n=1 Tax=Irpex rosettiformis TaxID=378272 RepID=A0ACB8TW01_9APHY|nr:small heat shock protein [Irpex rosettiformis]
MSLARFSQPFYSYNDFDRLFDEAFATRADNSGQVQRSGGPQISLGLLRPKIDVHEDTKTNLVTTTFELPGLAKEDVNIDVQNNVLTVSGESKASSEHDENGYAIRERRYGKFSRSVSVPQGIKTEDIKASLENGVLTVTFPKTTPEQTPKKITIA